MGNVTLSATPKGNGFQATVTILRKNAAPVRFSSAETYPTMAEAITAAAIKLLEMPERLATLDDELVARPPVAR